MNFLLTEDQKAYKREINEFATKYLNDESKYEIFSMELWKKTAELGLFGMTIGEEYDGLEESYLTAAIAMEELGHSCKNNGLVFVITNHIWVASNIIYLYGTEQQKKKYIPRMVSGELIGAFAVTEADAGSDALSMTTQVKEAEGGFVLNGSKMFISNGPIADVFIVIAKMDNRYTAFIVEKEWDGVYAENEIPKMGLDACPISGIHFDNCFIPAENVLGSVGSGNMILNEVITWERCYEFAPHVGAMQRILEQCLDYVNARKQFGKPIKDYQAISHKIADMEVAIEMSRNMLYKVAWLKDEGKRAYKESAIFKLYVSESYVKVCQDAMQIFGAYGYSKEYGIERELRDAMACTIYSGTSEIQRNTIFRLLG